MLFSLVFRSFYTGDNDHEFAIRYFHTFSVIGDMALGGLFAYLVSYENKFKSFVTNISKPKLLLLYALTLTVTLFKDKIFVPGVPVIFERIVIAFCFGMIILEQNYAKHSLFKMSHFKLMSNLVFIRMDCTACTSGTLFCHQDHGCLTFGWFEHLDIVPDDVGSAGIVDRYQPDKLILSKST